ncbi:MAG: DNA topoisomerase VI subunit B [Phycisphaerales bacterium]|nr:MAG: DNA topoisomerase VI subunit B [Phycisphaerales bacterium]
MSATLEMDGARARKPGTKTRSRATAESMASQQREISVSEFFAKNRHLLGFDNPRKALLTAVKEAVDNALDACEEGGVLPDIRVELEHLRESGEGRYRLAIQDNGPGIVRRQIENIFGKLLYGSKFHRLKMSRGQQGIGISAAGMYGLMTTGKPVMIISKTARSKPAHEVVLKMDTSKNKAEVVSETEHPEDDALFPDGHGTRVVIELEGKYMKGRASVDEYLELTAIANPHARITFVPPATGAGAENADASPATPIVFERAVDELPPEAQEIQPHPHGIELGTLIQMLERTESTQLGAFFKNDFCRVGPKVAKEICAEAGLTDRTWVKQVGHAEAERLYKAVQGVKIMAPPTDCLSPIGAKVLLKGLEKGLKPDFIAVSSRPPGVYRGRPFLIEAGVAFGGDLPADESARVHRFANRVPLQYQQAACASFKAVIETDWKRYGLQQPRGALPVGPLVVVIHMASVWVPFTSESKEAIADYDEIRKEMRLALMECGRKLGTYVRRRQRMKREGERRSVFERYIGEIAKSCERITGKPGQPVYDALLRMAQSKTEEADAVLDEEGKRIGRADPLERDEGVYIRERTDDDDAPVEAPKGAGVKKGKRVKVVKKKRVKTGSSGGAGGSSGAGGAGPAPKRDAKRAGARVVNKKKRPDSPGLFQNDAD